LKEASVYSFYEYSTVLIWIKFTICGFYHLFPKNLTESAKSLQIAMYLFDKFGKMAAIDLNILIN